MDFPYLAFLFTPLSIFAKNDENDSNSLSFQSEKLLQ